MLRATFRTMPRGIGGDTSCCLSVILTALVACSAAQKSTTTALPQSIPIGAVFGAADSRHVNTAFLYALEQHNKSSSIKFEKNIMTIDIADNVKMAHSSRCIASTSSPLVNRACLPCKSIRKSPIPIHYASGTRSDGPTDTTSTDQLETTAASENSSRVLSHPAAPSLTGAAHHTAPIYHNALRAVSPFEQRLSRRRRRHTLNGYHFMTPVCKIVSNGTYALFGQTHPASIATIQSFTSTFTVPMVTTSVPIRYFSAHRRTTGTPISRGGAVSQVFSGHNSAAVANLRSSSTLQFDAFDSYGVRPETAAAQRAAASYNTRAGSINGDMFLQPPPSRAMSPGGVPSVTSSRVVAAAHFASSADPNNYIIHMRPTYDRAIVAIVRHYRWKRVSYVYDNSEGLAHLEFLYHMFQADNTTRLEIDPVRLTDVKRCYNTLRQLDARDPRGSKYIVLDLSTDEALRSVLKQIEGVGMNRANYHYLLGGISMNEIDISDFRYGGVNITGFTLIDSSLPRFQAVQRELTQLNPNIWHGAGARRNISLEAALAIDSVDVLVHGLVSAKTASDQEAWRTVYRRGEFYNNGTKGIACRSPEPVPWQLGPDIMKHLKQTEMHGLTGRISFDDEGLRKDYKLDVNELTVDSDVQKIGEWDSKDGLNISRYTSPGPSIRPLPPNRTLIVTSIMNPPYLMVKKQRDELVKWTGNDRYEGYCVDLAQKILGERLRYNYEIRLVNDGMFGAKTAEGTWNGMVGELTRREADIAIAPLTITAIRERVIDFTKPFMQLGISIMIKKPEKQKPGVFSFMDPLSMQIWMCIVLSYLGVSFVLFLVSRFSPYEWQIEDRENGPTFTNDFTMLNSLWFSLGAFMRQGCDISPRSLSGRIVGSAWWFFTLIIISTYTANLAAFLTVERMLTPIESADDLAKQREIQYGTLDSGSTKDFFKPDPTLLHELYESYRACKSKRDFARFATSGHQQISSKIPVYERMWNFMSTASDVFVKTTDDGVAKVRNSKGKYAFLLESTMNEYHNQRKPCNTMKVGGDLDSKGYGIATPINSDLREDIGMVVLELLEKGELQKMHKKWWYDKGECVAEDPKSSGSSQSALTLSNVAGIFYILIGGLGLSMVMSLVEFAYKYKRQAIRKKKTFTQPEMPRPSQSFGSGRVTSASTGSCCTERKNGRLPSSVTTTQLTSSERQLSSSRGSLPLCNDVMSTKSMTPSGAIILV